MSAEYVAGVRFVFCGLPVRGLRNQFLGQFDVCGHPDLPAPTLAVASSCGYCRFNPGPFSLH